MQSLAAAADAEVLGERPRFKDLRAAFFFNADRGAIAGTLRSGDQTYLLISLGLLFRLRCGRTAIFERRAIIPGEDELEEVEKMSTSYDS